MVSTSQHTSRGANRRRADRRRDDKPFAGSERRVGARRSGADRRREQRD